MSVRVMNVSTYQPDCASSGIEYEIADDHPEPTTKSGDEPCGFIGDDEPAECQLPMQLEDEITDSQELDNTVLDIDAVDVDSDDEDFR